MLGKMVFYGQLLSRAMNKIGVTTIQPLDIGPLVSVAVGARHVCANFASRVPGEVRCWGNGEYGQRGNGGSDTFGNDEFENNISKQIEPVDLGNFHTSSIPSLFKWANLDSTSTFEQQQQDGEPTSY